MLGTGFGIVSNVVRGKHLTELTELMQEQAHNINTLTEQMLLNGMEKGDKGNQLAAGTKEVHLLHLQEQLDGIQDSLSEPIAVNAAQPVSQEVLDILSTNPWQCLDDCQPAENWRGKRHHGPNKIPILFEYNRQPFVGWINSGNMKPVLGFDPQILVNGPLFPKEAPITTENDSDKVVTAENDIPEQHNQYPAQSQPTEETLQEQSSNTAEIQEVPPEPAYFGVHQRETSEDDIVPVLLVYFLLVALVSIVGIVVGIVERISSSPKPNPEQVLTKHFNCDSEKCTVKSVNNVGQRLLNCTQDSEKMFRCSKKEILSGFHSWDNNAKMISWVKQTKVGRHFCLISSSHDEEKQNEAEVICMMTEQRIRLTPYLKKLVMKIEFTCAKGQCLFHKVDKLGAKHLNCSRQQKSKKVYCSRSEIVKGFKFWSKAAGFITWMKKISSKKVVCQIFSKEKKPRLLIDCSLINDKK